MICDINTSIQNNTDEQSYSKQELRAIANILFRGGKTNPPHILVPIHMWCFYQIVSDSDAKRL